MEQLELAALKSTNLDVGLLKHGAERFPHKEVGEDFCLAIVNLTPEKGWSFIKVVKFPSTPDHHSVSTSLQTP